MFTLQETAYFATNWAYLPQLPVGLGFRVGAQVALDNGLYGAVIEKLDGAGNVTDALVVYRGAELSAGGNTAQADVSTVLSLEAGESANTQAIGAASFYAAQAGAYAARGVSVAVAGHSLGGGLANFALGAALAAYGPDSSLVPTATTFAALDVSEAVRNRFGQQIAAFDGRTTNYVVDNDIFFGPDPGLPNDARLLSQNELGTRYLLPDYTPNAPGTVQADFANSAAAHLPAISGSVYNQAFGVPAFVGTPGVPAYYDAPTYAELAATANAFSLVTGVSVPESGGEGLVTQGPYASIAAQPLSISGDGGNNVLFGRGAGDFITGGFGADRILAGAGNDLALGNQGADTLYGGQGTDTLFGGQDGDLLLGDRGADLVFGNVGADLVLGNQDADSLFGGQGADTLYGGQGNDVLSGDLGDDLLSGDLGADRYVFGASSGADVVLGFNAAEGDRLDFGGQTQVLGSASNGDALFTLGGGGTVRLAGVTAASLGSNFLA